MAKPTEELQQELYQLLIQAGDKQYMLTQFRKTITQENDALNTLNQKIEAKQKEIRTALAQKPPEQAPPTTPIENITDAPKDENV